MRAKKKSSIERKAETFISRLSDAELHFLANDWKLFARQEQLPPKGDWFTWLLLGGRGAGKTRAGSEWVHDLVMYGELSGYKLSRGRVALVAETLTDAREIMIEGESGIVSVARYDRPIFQPSRRRLVWPNGGIAQIFSSEDPESLRGPQFDAAWCDELCKWRYPQETWDMLQFGLRLGESPRQLVTTTPKAMALLKAIIADEATVITHMRTNDNKSNLAKSFLENVKSRYGNTRLGRQELEGELLEEREGALWSRKQFDELRVHELPEFSRVVVAVDPPASSEAKNSCCGIVVVGLSIEGFAVVIKDGSIERASPKKWASMVARTYQEFEADLVVAEVNQGGDMVKSVLQAIDSKLPIRMVRATRGKWLRAEPVAALYEQKRVVHATGLEKLEDQMCDFTINGLQNGTSPDRLDALVWAITSLLLDKNGSPSVRQI